MAKLLEEEEEEKRGGPGGKGGGGGDGGGGSGGGGGWNRLKNAVRRARDAEGGGGGEEEEEEPLPPAMRHEMEESWKKFDIDKDGFIGPNDWTLALARDIGFQFTEREMRKFLKHQMRLCGGPEGTKGTKGPNDTDEDPGISPKMFARLVRRVGTADAYKISRAVLEEFVEAPSDSLFATGMQSIQSVRGARAPRRVSRFISSLNAEELRDRERMSHTTDTTTIEFKWRQPTEEQIMPLFKAINISGNGLINQQMLRNYLSYHLHMAPTKEECVGIVDMWDPHGKMALSYQDMVVIVGYLRLITPLFLARFLIKRYATAHPEKGARLAKHMAVIDANLSDDAEELTQEIRRNLFLAAKADKVEFMAREGVAPKRTKQEKIDLKKKKEEERARKEERKDKEGGKFKHSRGRAPGQGGGGDKGGHEYRSHEDCRHDNFAHSQCTQSKCSVPGGLRAVALNDNSFGSKNYDGSAHKKAHATASHAKQRAAAVAAAEEAGVEFDEEGEWKDAEGGQSRRGSSVWSASEREAGEIVYDATVEENTKDWIREGLSAWRPVARKDLVETYAEGSHSSKVATAELSGTRRQLKYASQMDAEASARLERAKFAGDAIAMRVEERRQERTAKESAFWTVKEKQVSEITRVHQYFPKLGGNDVEKWPVEWQGKGHERREKSKMGVWGRFEEMRKHAALVKKYMKLGIVGHAPDDGRPNTAPTALQARSIDVPLIHGGLDGRRAQAIQSQAALLTKRVSAMKTAAGSSREEREHARKTGRWAPSTAPAGGKKKGNDLMATLSTLPMTPDTFPLNATWSGTLPGLNGRIHSDHMIIASMSFSAKFNHHDHHHHRHHQQQQQQQNTHDGD